MKSPATPAFLMGLSVLFTTSCAKKTPEPAPLPEPTATFRRTVVYLDPAAPTRRDTTFQTASLTATSELNSAYLVVTLRSKPNQEGIDFRVDRSQLSKDLAGTYTYKSKVDYTAPPTTLYYYASTPGSNGSQGWTFGSLINYPIGSLVITAYDAQRKLLSGRFTTTMANTSDPMETVNAPISRRCDLNLSGTFTELILKGTE